MLALEKLQEKDIPVEAEALEGCEVSKLEIEIHHQIILDVTYFQQS